MINHLAECLENFKQEEHWKNEHFHWLKDYLENPEMKVIFFWNDFDPANDLELRVSNSAAPKFYEQNIRS